MRIEQLQYLAEVARLGSFSRAAEKLHITQPALSESVRGLERELGVHLLERGRHGARVSHPGQHLLPHVLAVLDSVDRLRQAAGEENRHTRLIRVGTVTTAMAPLLTPAIRRFRELHPATQVEVIGAQQDQIHLALLEGSFDLGLVNYLDGDDKPPNLDTTTLLRGHPVVCMRADSALARRDAVRISDLSSEPLIVMRSGYMMHRYIHRLLRDCLPPFSYSADGAEMGKLMVAEGLGLTVLPDFSVVGDTLEQRGVITWRPIIGDKTRVHLDLQRTGSRPPTRAVTDLHRTFVEVARTYASSGASPGRGSAASPEADVSAPPGT
ncbi:MAG: LysR family transcriptional regulator [Nocardiopsaceae bacterium]|nr:LysR family transcriptional regulator [Nocardiopsaceae bacterium]